MAIDSLFEDGTLPDWQEFYRALRDDKFIASETLFVCDHHSNAESVALARVLVKHFYLTADDMGLK